MCGLDDDGRRRQKQVVRVRRKKMWTGLVAGWGVGNILSYTFDKN
jgi:hypothetical protein